MPGRGRRICDWEGAIEPLKRMMGDEATEKKEKGGVTGWAGNRNCSVLL
jgi:hypothetical protein